MVRFHTLPHALPDTAVSTSMLVKYVEKARLKHEIYAIKVVKYLNSTVDLGLLLKLQSSTQLAAHADANWAGDTGTGRRSSSVVMIFHVSAMMDYRSSLQKCVSLSSAEAEYVALSESTKAVFGSAESLTSLE